MDNKTTERYVAKIDKLIAEGNLSGYSAALKELDRLDSKESATILMRGFLRSYTSFRADAIALFMEMAIRHNMEWAKVHQEDNPLFRVCLVSGSMDLYDCYVEEVSGLDQEWFKKMVYLAAAHNEKLLTESSIVLKGRDYNSGFTENGRRLINMDDFEIMNETMERYNRIIGLRMILGDLLHKAGMK